MRGAGGTSVGELSDMLIQPASGANGQIVYGVIGSGGILGRGEQMTPVPWRLLTYSGVGILAIDASPATVQQAPHFNGSLPTQSNSGWTQPLRTYWQKAAPGSGGS